MKNINSIIFAFFLLLIANNVFAQLEHLSVNCGVTCGKAQLSWYYGPNRAHTWSAGQAPTAPANVDWEGTITFRVRNRTTGTNVYNVTRSFNLLNIPVTSIAGGGKESVLVLSTALFPNAISGFFDADPGEYDVYIYFYYQLRNSSTGTVAVAWRSQGSTTIPLTTDMNLTTFPKVVNQSHVQNSNTPTSLNVDGYDLNPSVPTVLYSCKPTQPVRVNFANITQCRTYTIKID